MHWPCQIVVERCIHYICPHYHVKQPLTYSTALIACDARLDYIQSRDKRWREDREAAAPNLEGRTCGSIEAVHDWPRRLSVCSSVLLKVNISVTCGGEIARPLDDDNVVLLPFQITCPGVRRGCWTESLDSVITMIVMHHVYSQLFMMNRSDHPIASFVDIVITLEEIRPRRLEYHNKFSWRSWYVQSGAYSLYSGRRFELRDMVH